MDIQIKNQLDTLVNKQLSYDGFNFVVKSYKEVNGLIVILTSGRTYNFYPNEIQEKFLDQIGDVVEKKEFVYQGNISANREESTAIIQPPTENNTIKDTLLEALKKVKEDPGFINQAKAICDITNTMVNIQRTEIDMIRLSQKK